MSVEEFSELLSSSKKPIFVLWSAAWCMPCKLIKPSFIEAGENNTKAIFVVIDVDESPELLQEYDIKGIPTMKVFVNSVCKETYSGTDTNTLDRLINKYTH